MERLSYPFLEYSRKGVAFPFSLPLPVSLNTLIKLPKSYFSRFLKSKIVTTFTFYTQKHILNLKFLFTDINVFSHFSFFKGQGRSV